VKMEWRKTGDVRQLFQVRACIKVLLDMAQHPCQTLLIRGRFHVSLPGFAHDFRAFLVKAAIFEKSARKVEQSIPKRQKMLTAG
jgi:hypothetical protein